MADERKPLSAEEVAQVFGGLSDQAREKLAVVLAQFLREREREQELLDRLRDLK